MCQCITRPNTERRHATRLGGMVHLAPVGAPSRHAVRLQQHLRASCFCRLRHNTTAAGSAQRATEIQDSVQAADSKQVRTAQLLAAAVSPRDAPAGAWQQPATLCWLPPPTAPPCPAPAWPPPPPAPCPPAAQGRSAEWRPPWRLWVQKLSRRACRCTRCSPCGRRRTTRCMCARCTVDRCTWRRRPGTPRTAQPCVAARPAVAAAGRLWRRRLGAAQARRSGEPPRQATWGRDGFDARRAASIKFHVTGQEGCPPAPPSAAAAAGGEEAQAGPTCPGGCPPARHPAR